MRAWKRRRSFLLALVLSFALPSIAHAQFTGWFAEIKKRDGALMRYAIVSSEYMCWQKSVWVAYTLAPPKKPARKK